MLREHIKEPANEHKHGELNEYDGAAGQQGPAAVALVFSGEQALPDSLVRAMAGHSEKRAADQSGPERVFRGEIPGKIQRLKFVARRSCNLRDFAPAAGNAVQQDEEVDTPSGEAEQ